MSFPAGAIPTSGSASETSALSLTIPFNDPVGTSWSAAMDYNNDGIVDETLSGFTQSTGLVISYLYSDSGSLTLSFVITNEDGNTLSGQFPVTVANSAPTASFSSQDTLEGSTATLTATGADS
ncbi:MAG: hypothetical protein ACKOAH_04440, partial [Pirellula sp.]